MHPAQLEDLRVDPPVLILELAVDFRCKPRLAGASISLHSDPIGLSG